jgi:hypothetical protein
VRPQIILTATFLGLALASACVSDRSDVGAVALGPCVGNVAKEIPTSECPVTCSGDIAYALCNGTEYSSCQCSLPGGFTLAGGDSGIVDAEPDTSLSPLDSEALGIGPCSGKVVLVIPSADCASFCAGSIAYAVCDGTRYSECSCNIPKGYKIAVAESGLVESGGEASFDASDASDAGKPMDAHDEG